MESDLIIEPEQVLQDAEALLGDMTENDRDTFMARLWKVYEATTARKLPPPLPRCEPRPPATRDELR